MSYRTERQLAEPQAPVGDGYYVHAYSDDRLLLLLEHRGRKDVDRWQDLFVDRDVEHPEDVPLLASIGCEFAPSAWHSEAPYYRHWNGRVYRLIRAMDTRLSGGVWPPETSRAIEHDNRLFNGLTNAKGARLF